MIVHVENQEIDIFSGALVKDALLKYSKTEYHEVLNGTKQTVDKWGNRVETDGELSENQKLFIKPIPGEKS